MKISTSCEHGIAAGLSARESLKLMKQAGFEGIDLSLCRYMGEPEKFLTEEWTRAVLEKAHIAKEEGLEIAQCHLPYGPGHLENPGDGSAKAFGEAAATRLIQLGSVHPADRDFAAHLKEVSAAGFKGIKLHPFYQNFRLDDPRVFPYFTALRDAGLFVIAHCGIDLGFTDVPMSCGPQQIAALLRAVPGLTFIAAHLGGCGGNPPHAVDELLEFPDCYFDTAVVCCCDDDLESQRVMAEWPVDRLLFATDYFWRDVTHIADWVRRYRSDPGDLEKIFSGNARRLLGLI